MNTLIRIAVLILLNLISLTMQGQDTYTVRVEVDGLDSNEGKVFIALYNSEEDFLEKTFKGTTSTIDNNTCSVVFESIPKGFYAVSIFHDENDNGKMDKNFMGIPKEDYGCSNGASGFMGPPKWNDAKFELNDDKSITITL